LQCIDGEEMACRHLVVESRGSFVFALSRFALSKSILGKFASSKFRARIRRWPRYRQMGMQVARFRSNTSTDRHRRPVTGRGNPQAAYSPMKTQSRPFASTALERRNVGSGPFVGFLSGIVSMSLTTQRRQDVAIDVGKLCRLRAE
jgi:hypothetical protein